jgi:hypothetical protein
MCRFNAHLPSGPDETNPNAPFDLLSIVVFGYFGFLHIQLPFKSSLFNGFDARNPLGWA